jgi:signal transduction histidine kinase
MTTSPNPEAAFIGKITAAATHEIRNALAIIKESAGLIGDLVRLSGTDGSLDRERVLKAVGRIDAQVGRGAEVATSLNRVAHALDRDVGAVDLDEEVRQVVFHAQRAARRKSQAVKAGPTRPTSPVRASPLHVQMALYATVEECLARLGEGATLELSAGAHARRPSVDVAAADDVPLVLAGEGMEWDGLKETLEGLGVSLESSGTGNGVRLLFEAPE